MVKPKTTARKSTLSLASRLRVMPDVVSRTVQGEEVILNLVSGIYFGLNKTGTSVWEMLRSGHSLDEIAHSLCQDYGIGERKAQGDVLKLATVLVDKGLLEASPSA